MEDNGFKISVYNLQMGNTGIIGKLADKNLEPLDVRNIL